jgi:hypothetical protein
VYLFGKVERKTISPDFVMQALAVYAGQTCLGHILPRADGFEAFGADDHALGVFPTQKAAADAVSEAAS